MASQLVSMRVAALLALSLPVAATASAADEPVPSIEAMMSAPFPGEAVATSDGRQLVWVETRRGVRNVYIANVAGGPARQLTRYTEDDGQAIGADGIHGGSGLAISDDGSCIAYARGNPPDGGGWSVNPASDPDGTEQAVWTIASDGTAAPVRAGAGHNPQFRPGSTDLLFLNAGKPYLHRDEQNDTDPLFVVHGTVTAAAWSPDGSQIAFVSERGQHGFVGIYSLAGRSIRWMAPEMSRDILPSWSPDGRHLAFIRLPGRRFGTNYDITDAERFAIVVADVASGMAKVIFQSNETAGGFAQEQMASGLRWTAQGVLLFNSEETGWMRIMAIRPDGGGLRALTPDGCEVETSDLSPDGRTLFVSSNCEDIDGRQLSRIDVASGRSQPIRTGFRVSVQPVALGDDGTIAFKGMSATAPAALMRWSGGNASPLSGAAHLPVTPVRPRDVQFTAQDGLTIHGQLFEPPANRRNGAAIVYVHGGPIRQMFSTWHYFDYYSNDYAVNQTLALKGYTVLSVNYRSGIGYGQAFRQAPDQGPRGASEYADVLAGHAFLTTLPGVDPKRIGIWGGSYSGLLTAQALARDSDKFAAGVDIHGVHDWRVVGETEQGGGWGLSGEKTLKRAYDSSPVAHIAGWRSPVLLIHGDDDRSVNFAQSVDLLVRLRARHVDVETLSFPDEEHDFLRAATWVRAGDAILDFFDRRLGRAQR